MKDLNPKDEEHEEMVEWMGEDFDPAAFSCAEADWKVQALFVVGGELLADEEGDWPELDEDYGLDPEVECLYDADRGPEPELWLGLDPSLQQYHVRLYHLRQKEPWSPGTSIDAHAVMHTIVETQIAEKNPALARQTLVRLLGEGLGRHEAIHAIGSVVAKEIYRLLRGKDEGASFDELAYASKLKKLRAADWL